MTRPTHAEVSPTLVDPDAILTIDNLKTYFFLEGGTVRAVDGVNLALKRNQTLGLVGESGCGKSITAMSIMRLLKSPPGKIVAGRILFHQRQNGGARTIDLAQLKPQGREMRE